MQPQLKPHCTPVGPWPLLVLKLELELDSLTPQQASRFQVAYILRSSILHPTLFACNLLPVATAAPHPAPCSVSGSGATEWLLVTTPHAPFGRLIETWRCRAGATPAVGTAIAPSDRLARSSSLVSGSVLSNLFGYLRSVHDQGFHLVVDFFLASSLSLLSRSVASTTCPASQLASAKPSASHHHIAGSPNPLMPFPGLPNMAATSRRAQRGASAMPSVEIRPPSAPPAEESMLVASRLDPSSTNLVEQPTADYDLIVGAASRRRVTAQPLVLVYQGLGRIKQPQPAALPPPRHPPPTAPPPSIPSPDPLPSVGPLPLLPPTGTTRGRLGGRNQRPYAQFGSYMLLHTLGEGQWGKVKLGIRSPQGDEVAIKLIKRSTLSSASPSASMSMSNHSDAEERPMTK